MTFNSSEWLFNQKQLSIRSISLLLKSKSDSDRLQSLSDYWIFVNNCSLIYKHRLQSCCNQSEWVCNARQTQRYNSTVCILLIFLYKNKVSTYASLQSNCHLAATTSLHQFMNFCFISREFCLDDKGNRFGICASLLQLMAVEPQTNCMQMPTWPCSIAKW